MIGGVTAVTAMGSLPTGSGATATGITIKGGPEPKVVYRVERRGRDEVE